MNNRLKITSEEVDQINLRSDEVKEIMGHIPVRIIRYGITVITVILIGVFSFSFYFRYPDVINGLFYIQTSNPPAFMISRASGKIQALFVNEADTVFRGKLLSVIENATNIEAYQKLKIAIYSDLPMAIDSSVDMIKLEALGELQTPYANYQKALEEIHDYRSIAYYTHKIKMLESKEDDYKKHIFLLQKQVNASIQNYLIAEKDYRRDSMLYKNETIAAVEYEKAEKELINQKMSLTNSEIELSNMRMELTDLQSQISEMQLNAQQEEKALQATLYQTLNQLKGAMDEWEKRYCLISPLRGKVAFSGIWEKDQNVQSGQHVMTILPLKESKLVGKVRIPIDRAGKVKVNQPVKLKFADFPYREYGMVTAELDAISAVPDSVYIGTVYLSDSLITNYGKLLPFKQNMVGIAEIVTEDLALPERLIYPLKAIFKEHIR